MKYNLADICEYAKGKVDVAILDDETYISTENMMPNKGGITSASSLPTITALSAYWPACRRAIRWVLSCA